MKQLPQILSLINMGIAVVLVIFISLQNKSSGLSSVFGGQGVVQTRRGIEKWLFYGTIALAVLFVGLSLTVVVLSK